MRAQALLLTLLVSGSAWADGMVGVPDAASERITADQPAGRRHIVIHGNATSQLRLVDHEAYLARERTEEDARRRIREQEIAAAIAYTSGSAEQAAREARNAADLAASRQRRELELQAAGNFAFGCYFYDPNTGCRGSATGK